MDLVDLENKLKEIGSSSGPVNTKQDDSNTITPVSVTKKISTISDEEVQSYSDKVIPSWNDLQTIYESRWRKKKKVSSSSKGKLYCINREICVRKTRIISIMCSGKKGKIIYYSIPRVV